MPYGIDPTDISLGSIPNYVWIILLIVGLLLCFFGEIIWEFMIAILGAIIGSIIGAAIGYSMGGYVCAFGMSIICAIIGSMLFQLLAKTAVALLLAFLVFAGVAYLAYTSGLDAEVSLIVGLIVGVIIFIIARLYIEEIIGVFLAAIGGLLVGVGVYFLAKGDLALAYAVLAGGSMFILGAIFQIMYQRQRKGPSRRPPKKEPVRDTQPPAERTKLELPSTREPKPPIQ